MDGNFDTRSAKQDQNKQDESVQDNIDIEEAIEILKEHQQKCEDDGRYVEAEMAMNRIKELKKQHQENTKCDLEEKHSNDLIELEESHIQEFNNFNSEWDSRMNEFQSHSKQLIDALEEKHEQQYLDRKGQLEEKTPEGFKPSTQLIGLKKMQISLAKQKEYQQAHQIQIEANKLEHKERQKCLQERDIKIDTMLRKLVKQQEVEMESLRKRIIAGENEQKKQRALELERMFQRYNNIKKELENTHKKDKNYLTKGQSVYNANASMMSRRSNASKASSIKGINASSQKKKPMQNITNKR